MVRNATASLLSLPAAVHCPAACVPLIYQLQHSMTNRVPTWLRESQGGSECGVGRPREQESTVGHDTGRKGGRATNQWHAADSRFQRAAVSVLVGRAAMSVVQGADISAASHGSMGTGEAAPASAKRIFAGVGDVEEVVFVLVVGIHVRHQRGCGTGHRDGSEESGRAQEPDDAMLMLRSA